MKTSRTISNISYNTPEHFEGVVYDLVDRGIIEWCYWILHKPEDDELKEHIHLVLQPSARLETAQLEKEFLEIDRNNPKPLGLTKKWHFTSGQEAMSNWILYDMHHPGYLASKGQIRKYTYKLEDFHATDWDAFMEDVHQINLVQFNRLEAIADAVANRIPFPVLVQNGVIPIGQRAQWEAQYNGLMQLQRNKQTGRKESHEDIPAAFLQEPDEKAIQMDIESLGFKPLEDDDIPF